MTTDGLTPNELPGVADYESAMPPAGPMKNSLRLSQGLASPSTPSSAPQLLNSTHSKKSPRSRGITVATNSTGTLMVWKNALAANCVRGLAQLTQSMLRAAPTPSSPTERTCHRESGTARSTKSTTYGAFFVGCASKRVPPVRSP